MWPRLGEEEESQDFGVAPERRVLVLSKPGTSAVFSVARTASVTAAGSGGLSNAISRARFKNCRSGNSWRSFVGSCVDHDSLSSADRPWFAVHAAAASSPLAHDRVGQSAASRGPSRSRSSLPRKPRLSLAWGRPGRFAQEQRQSLATPHSSPSRSHMLRFPATGTELDDPESAAGARAWERERAGSFGSR